MHEYKAYTRDPNLSLAAKGVLSTIALPEFDYTGATLADLAAMSDDPASSLMPVLSELVDTGYVIRHETPRQSAFRSAWHATDKAFRTLVE